MKKSIAEFIGTFTLVLIGCGSAVIAGPAIAVLGIALAFGLAIVAMAYGIGPVSGCHVNPAVSVGAWFAGRMSTRDLVNYVIAQCLGAIAGAIVLYIIMSGKASGWEGGLGANGWGAGYLGEYNVVSAFIFEVVATFIFLVTILGVTQKGAPSHLAGLAIGLTLAAIHIVGINVTGVSVNPARSLGPALLSGGAAMAQLWLFIVAPVIGAAIAGMLFKSGILSADEPDVKPGVSPAKAAVAR
jgi:aquaporin Z